MSTPIPYTRGNAVVDGKAGWFVGQFVPEEYGLRSRTDVEIKWGIHPQGETRTRWSRYRTAVTIPILLQGQCLIRLRIDGLVHDVLLKEPGDYLIMNPGIDHTWKAVSDCIVLTIRCPSVPNDVVESQQ